jgi:hypothetical protein
MRQARAVRGSAKCPGASGVTFILLVSPRFDDDSSAHLATGDDGYSRQHIARAGSPKESVRAAVRLSAGQARAGSERRIGPSRGFPPHTFFSFPFAQREVWSACPSPGPTGGLLFPDFF